MKCLSVCFGEAVPAQALAQVCELAWQLRGWMDAEAYNLAAYHTVSRIAKGAKVGAEASTNKIFWSELDLLLHETAMRNVTPCASIDASRRLAQVEWAPRPETRVADAASGRHWWDETLDRAAVNVSGQLAGLAQRMLDLSVDYAALREQFGKPIGSFQAVKHHLADVVTRIEFAKPALYHAADALARGLPPRAARVSHAKLACADAAWIAARKGIQVHGAMGYTWEADLQMFMKRVWALDAAWGDRAFHKARLAEAVLAEGAELGPAATFRG